MIIAPIIHGDMQPQAADRERRLCSRLLLALPNA